MDREEEVREEQPSILDIDFMPNVTFTGADNLIYFKFLDFITGGRAFRVFDILMFVVEILVTFAVVLLFMGTNAIFAKFSYSILPTFIFVLLMAILMVLTLQPKFNKNNLSYTVAYGKSIRPKLLDKIEDNSKYQQFAKILPNGDIVYLLIGNGRMSELLFENEKIEERKRVAVQRNELEGIVVTNNKGYASQTFKTQKNMINSIIKNTEDEDLRLFAKKSMLFYADVLHEEKVERQFLTFTTHNRKEREVLEEVLESWESQKTLVIDEKLSKEHIQEIFEEF